MNPVYSRVKFKTCTYTLCIKYMSEHLVKWCLLEKQHKYLWCCSIAARVPLFKRACPFLRFFFTKSPKFAPFLSLTPFCFKIFPNQRKNPLAVPSILFIFSAFKKGETVLIKKQLLYKWLQSWSWITGWEGRQMKKNINMRLKFEVAP